MRNGTRAGKRRSGIETISPTAGPEEAAAISAALERFLVETAPAAAQEESGSCWQRVALREAVEARDVARMSWRNQPR